LFLSQKTACGLHTKIKRILKNNTEYRIVVGLPEIEIKEVSIL
jgi:hypothetical protein